MNSAKGYYYDYEGNFLGGPYKGSTKVKVCKQKIKEVKIEKNGKIPYDVFTYPIDLNIEYDDFILLAATNFGESSQFNEYNTVLSKDRKAKRHFVSKINSYKERSKIVQCCLSYSDLHHSGSISNAILKDKNYTYAKDHEPFKIFKETFDDKRNDKETMKISIKATINGILTYREDKNKNIVIATHWDGIDVIKNWNNPHERNRAGTIDIENNFSQYVDYLLTINYPIDLTGLKNCYVEIEKIQKKYDLEIEDIKKEKKTTEDNKQKHIKELEKRKTMSSNFEKIKKEEVLKKIKEMRSTVKGKQLSVKEDFQKAESKLIALKKGYLTMGLAGGSILYIEYRNPNFKNIIQNQLEK